MKALTTWRALGAMGLVVAVVTIPAGLFVAGFGHAQSSGSTSPITIATGITNLNAAPTVSAVNTAATRTLTGGVSGQRVCLRSLFIRSDTGAIFTLTISDGAVIVLDLGVESASAGGSAVRFIGTPLLCATGTNNLTINVGNGGAGAITITTTVADRS